MGVAHRHAEAGAAVSGRQEKKLRRIGKPPPPMAAIDMRRQQMAPRMEALLGRAMVEGICCHPRGGAMDCRWCASVESVLRFIRADEPLQEDS